MWNFRTAMVCIAALWGIVPQAAQAQGFQHFTNDLNYNLEALMDHLMPAGVTDLRIGIGPAFVPNYEGDNHERIVAVPVVSFRYKDIVAMDGTQVRVNLLDLHQSSAPQKLSAGPMVNIDFGRRESDSPDLKGLGNIGTSVELGGFVNYNIGPGRIRAVIRQDVADGHSGAVAELDAGMNVFRTSRFNLAGQVAVVWSSSRYMESFYGVTSAQSAASGLPIYTPGSGIKSATLTFAGEYKIIQQWSVVVTTAYERLTSGAADSPLVRLRGSPNQLSVGTFVIYSF